MNNINICDEPHPDTPCIDESVLKEISDLSIKDLGSGIVVFKNALSFDQNLIFDYVDSLAEEFHKKRWTYITDENGVQYGINEDGFRYHMQDIPSTPIRILCPVNKQTPENVKQFFHRMEEQIYKCLIRYIDLFPLIVGCLWWRNRGHILRYIDHGILGSHCDNDTNYKVTNGVRYMPKGQLASRQTCGALVYLNDCVDSNDELDETSFVGGHLRFFYLGIEYKPQKGDIIIFPTNYVASHDVTRMTSGMRYSYLTFFGQGSSDLNAGINIVEPEESFEWCPAVWMNNIYDDYEKYCKSEYSLYNSKDIEHGHNPVYQGRCVDQYNNTHISEKIT